MPLRIVADLPPAPRASFGARLQGAELHLPAELGALLQRHGLLSAEELIACACSFPSLLTAELDWSLDEVQRALDEVTGTLEGHLPDELLHPAVPTPRAYGARPPRGKERP
jgi:hypothetical protein